MILPPEDLVRLRRDLAAIRTRIEELHDAIQEHSRAIHAAQKAQQQAQEARNPVPVIVSYNDQTVGDMKAEQDRQYRTQNSIKNWTKAAVIAASIYAGIAALTYREIYKSTATSYRSADAAKSAADTAKAALHISERAYLTTGQPQSDFVNRTVTLPLVNSGRIPSGNIEEVIHEATTIQTGLNSPVDFMRIAEKHWKRHQLPSAPPGQPFNILIPTPSSDETKLKTMLQAMVIAGRITYSDGFSDDPPQDWLLCADCVSNAGKADILGAVRCESSYPQNGGIGRLSQ